MERSGRKRKRRRKTTQVPPTVVRDGGCLHDEQLCNREVGKIERNGAAVEIELEI